MHRIVIAATALLLTVSCDSAESTKGKGAASAPYAGSSSPEACAGGCKTTAASAASPPAAEVLDNLDTCIRSCHADKTVIPTNRRTCELNCTQRARVAATPPPGAAAAKAP